MKRRIITILLAAIMLLGCLTACSNSDANKNNDDNDKSGNPSPSNSGEENVFIFSRSATVNGFDPIRNFNGMTCILSMLFYESLVTSDYSADGSYEPELATSWDISDDRLTWTFHLREGIEFTDGNPFGSDDVAGVFNRIFTVEALASRRDGYKFVESWETPDDYTFVMHLNTPVSENYLLNKLTTLFIWSNERYEEYGEDMFLFDDTMKPVGTGAFIPDKWIVGGDVEFVRNTDWWGIGVLGEESNVDRLIYRPLTEEATRIAGIQTGELDWIDNLSLEYMDRLASETHVVPEKINSSLFVYMMLATDRGIFQDKNARLAAYYAIDREMLATAIAGGGEGAATPLPSTCIGFDSDAVVPAQDLDKARDLLAQTDYNGEELVLLCSNGLFGRSKEIYEAVASMLTEAGFNISLQVLDNATVGTMRSNKEYDIHITNVICGNYPLDMLDRWLNDVHKTGYSNPEMFALIEEGYAAPDQATEREKFMAAAAMAIEEAAPAIGLYRGDVLIAYRDNISNFDFCDSRYYFNFSHVQKG